MNKMRKSLALLIYMILVSCSNNPKSTSRVLTDVDESRVLGESKFSNCASADADSSGELSESKIYEKLSNMCVNTDKLFPIFGFIKAEGSIALPPGLTNQELMEYGDSYGVRKFKMPTGASADLKRNIYKLVSEYNRMSLSKIKNENE